tara:strand:- start:4060 stop:4959 length:900 start_codon:yes stop_codon:yes gene_type:complete
MVDFSVHENCKICDQKGVIFFSKKYNDETLKSFFCSYYGQNKYEKLISKLENINYVLLTCNNCQFVWQKYSPINEFSNELYENIIDKSESFKKSNQKFLKSRDRNKLEIDLIFEYFKRNVKILDFGAGWGHWLKSNSNKMIDTFAFEVSSSRKKYLKENNLKILNLDDLQNYSGFFDYIRFDQVLEHLDNVNDVLSVLKKISNPKCILFVSVPDGSKVINTKKIDSIGKGPIQPLEHLNCFNRFSLKRLFEKHGFVQISLFETFLINLKNFRFNLRSIKLFLNDLKNHFFSTTIKFKIK